MALPEPSFHSLNAPRENGGVLIEPEAGQAGQWAEVNHERIAACQYDVQGRSLAQLACEAREQLFTAALEYTRTYRDVSVSSAAGKKFFLAGHQPEMFHPGVWLKNFVLHRLASNHGGIAINLQIDSDAVKSTSLRVPGGSVERPRIEAIAFDRAMGGIPWEQRKILKEECFRSFGSRVTEHLRPVIARPLMEQYWPMVVAQSQETPRLGACLAQARHQLEGKWGLETLEITQSRVCDLPAMRWFVVHLLAHLPRLWEVYNSSLAQYRREHKVRSAAHPVPELDAEDGWLEAPLWIWSEKDPQRRRLFVRQRNDELVLTDRAGLETTISITAEGDASGAIEQLAALAKQGIRIRTRALVTTLAARLLLGDLFMHGIGGAKYDRLTDRILEQFFGLKPPGYMVVSGTLHLPVDHQPVSRQNLRSLEHKIRELQFHPERFVSASSNGRIDQWIAEKQRWLATEQTRANARQRCRAIRHANEAMQEAVAEIRAGLLSEAEQLAQTLRTQTILGSREYAFPLFPEVALTKFLL